MRLKSDKLYPILAKQSSQKLDVKTPSSLNLKRLDQVFYLKSPLNLRLDLEMSHIRITRIRHGKVSQPKDIKNSKKTVQ